MKKNTIKKFTTSATAAAVISSSLIAGIGTVVQADELPDSNEKADQKTQKAVSKKEMLDAAKKRQAETQKAEDQAKADYDQAAAKADAAKKLRTTLQKKQIVQ